MAFTRSELRIILGDARTDEIENKLVALHLCVVDALKDERDSLKAERGRLKAEADKLPDVQKELDSLKNGEDFKDKYLYEIQLYMIIFSCVTKEIDNTGQENI